MIRASLLRPLTVAGFLALAISGLAPMAKAAPWEGVFEGTLGKARIIVELNAGADKSEYKGGYSDGSRYSYLPKAYDLKLVLDSEGQTLEFTESTLPHYAVQDLPKDDPALTGHWSLRVDGKGAAGTWTSSNGKKSLPIKLKRLALVDESAVPEQQNQLSTTYNERWFETVKLGSAEKPKSFGSVTIAHEKDSAFNLEMPVFTAFPDSQAMEKANTLLRQFYRRSLISTRDCVNMLREEPKQPFEPQFMFEVSYASPRVMSMQESGSVDCGGAHPNNYVTFSTFDLVNGKQIGGEYDLDLSDKGFGSVLKLGSKDERIAFEKFALQRWYDAAKADGDTGEESCSNPDLLGEAPEGERRFSLAFTDKGLAVHQSNYPHVASNCLLQDYNPTIIPWADVKPWLKPGQVLLKEEVE